MYSLVKIAQALGLCLLNMISKVGLVAVFFTTILIYPLLVNADSRPDKVIPSQYHTSHGEAVGEIITTDTTGVVSKHTNSEGTADKKILNCKDNSDSQCETSGSGTSTASCRGTCNTNYDSCANACSNDSSCVTGCYNTYNTCISGCGG